MSLESMVLDAHRKLDRIEKLLSSCKVGKPKEDSSIRNQRRNAILDYFAQHGAATSKAVAQVIGAKHASTGSNWCKKLVLSGELEWIGRGEYRLRNHK